LEGPGAGPPSPWLGPAPEATPGTRTRAPCGRLPRSSITRLREAPRLATSPRTAWPAGRYGWRIRRRPGRPCAGDPQTTWPRVAPPGPRGAASLCACPQQARHPRPSPPWKGCTAGSLEAAPSVTLERRAEAPSRTSACQLAIRACPCKVRLDRPGSSTVRADRQLADPAERMRNTTCRSPQLASKPRSIPSRTTLAAANLR
jgi:hypothetical protein